MKTLRVISERVMSAGFEPSVKRLMEGMQAKVRTQPGLLSIELLNDLNDSTRFVILTEWNSKPELDTWLQHPQYKEITRKLDQVLDQPTKYRIFCPPQEDIFLL